ncbi:unnamed protein product [Cercopithifilaria johnstoni]|uniref:Uncharacterized protein n=1 Tax=Cercopithifilaria johnstoni TaxID=2874296 RepID=A0A8J2M7Q6_9BILA|nr:unnamed protein product [Cercopithifilaria johnstoni]
MPPSVLEGRGDYTIHSGQLPQENHAWASLAVPSKESLKEKSAIRYFLKQSLLEFFFSVIIILLQLPVTLFGVFSHISPVRVRGGKRKYGSGILQPLHTFREYLLAETWIVVKCKHMTLRAFGMTLLNGTISVIYLFVVVRPLIVREAVSSSSSMNSGKCNSSMKKNCKIDEVQNLRVQKLTTAAGLVARLRHRVTVRSQSNVDVMEIDEGKAK